MNRMIATLTFDDGYQPCGTADVLDIAGNATGNVLFKTVKIVPCILGIPALFQLAFNAVVIGAVCVGEIIVALCNG